MGTYTEAFWQGRMDIPGRRNQQSGPYQPYIPDKLTQIPLQINPSVASRAAQLERRIRDFNLNDSLIGVDTLARLMIRREAVASSNIEGLNVGPKRLAIAQLLAKNDPAKGSEQHTVEAEVIANIDLVYRAANALADKDEVSVADIIELQQGLVRWSGMHGLRTAQNWVGGNEFHPLNAEYVPPPADRVFELMEDLAAYLSGSSHGVLIKAALVHAQFETIHPFADGNGRVGRALVHTVIRRHYGSQAVLLPISAALATRSQMYVRGLTSFRSDAPVGSKEWNAAIAVWVEAFLDATEAALNLAERFERALTGLSEEWRVRSENARLKEAGVLAHARRLRAERADSSTRLVREQLPYLPIFTAQDMAERLGRSRQAIAPACDKLAELGIIQPLSLGKNRKGWWAQEIFQLFSEVENDLARTNWGLGTRGICVDAAGDW